MKENKSSGGPAKASAHLVGSCGTSMACQEFTSFGQTKLLYHLPQPLDTGYLKERSFQLEVEPGPRGCGHVGPSADHTAGGKPFFKGDEEGVIP